MTDKEIPLSGELVQQLLRIAVVIPLEEEAMLEAGGQAPQKPGFADAPPPTDVQETGTLALNESSKLAQLAIPAVEQVGIIVVHSRGGPRLAVRQGSGAEDKTTGFPSQ